MNEKNMVEKVVNNADLRDEKGINEALFKKGFYSKSHEFPIAALQFELTSRCNLACKHCYNNSGVNNISDAMTTEKWVLFSKYLIEHGGIFECMISGGEPLLLGNDLFEIMNVLHDGGSVFFINTNGYFLTDSMVSKLKNYHYHKIQVSIDGVTAEYHDSFRQKRGSWEKAVVGASAIARTGIPLKIAHCITPFNLYDIDKMCDFAYSIGAEDLMIGELSFSGRAAENHDLLLSSEQRKILHQMVDENCTKYKGRMKVRSTHSVKDGLIKHSQYPNSKAVIRPNGDIRIDGMAPFVIGNVLTDDFADIWTKKIFDAWKHPKVLDFITSFDDNDRNLLFVNHLEGDIYI